MRLGPEANLTLIGMPGVGKSTVAAIVSALEE